MLVYGSTFTAFNIFPSFCTWHLSRPACADDVSMNAPFSLSLRHGPTVENIWLMQLWDSHHKSRTRNTYRHIPHRQIISSCFAVMISLPPKVMRTASECNMRRVLWRSEGFTIWRCQKYYLWNGGNLVNYLFAFSSSYDVFNHVSFALRLSVTTFMYMICVPMHVCSWMSSAISLLQKCSTQNLHIGIAPEANTLRVTQQ